MINTKTHELIEYTKTESSDMPSYVLSLGINLFFFLLLFIPSMTRYWAMLLLGFDVLYLLMIKDNLKKNLYLNIGSIMIAWLLFTLFSFGSLAMTGSNFFDGAQFIFTLALCYFNFVLLISNDRWLKVALRMLLITSLFFLFGSVLQIFLPDLVLEINRLHLSDVLFEQSLEFYRNGSLNGFTYQTALNGFMLSILLGIIVGYIYKANSVKSKVFLWFSYLFVFYLLVLTRKRGFILFAVLTLAYIIFRISERKIMAIVAILIMSFLLGILLIRTEVGAELIRRTLSQEDFTTGRSAMIQVMWNDFLKSPILGSGTYTTIDVVDYHHGHNIYFQVLRETGLLGFASLITALVTGFIRTNMRLNRFRDDKFKKMILIISIYFQLLFIFWGATGNPLYDTYPLFFYFVAIAMSETLSDKNYNIYGLNQRENSNWEQKES